MTAFIRKSIFSAAASISLIWLAMTASPAAHASEFLVDVEIFDAIKVFDNINVVCVTNPDSVGLGRYQAPDRMADAFYFTNSKGVLSVRKRQEFLSDTSDFPTLFLYTDRIRSIDNSTDSSVEVKCSSPVPELRIKLVGNGQIIVSGIKANELKASQLAGNGKIILSGSASRAKFKILGKGRILADELKCQSVKCQTVGAGMIGCWPVASLEVRGLGSTHIYYKGSPAIKKSGGGTLVPLLDNSDL